MTTGEKSPVASFIRLVTKMKQEFTTDSMGFRIRVGKYPKDSQDEGHYGRKYICVNNYPKDDSVDGTTSRSMYYARYLMILLLGRILTENEEVDHIDNDFTNDHPDNLQVISTYMNLRKEQGGPRFGLFTCPVCGRYFEKDNEHSPLYHYDPPGLTTCSKTCSRYQMHSQKREGVIEDKFEEEDGFVFRKNYHGEFSDNDELIALFDANGIKHNMGSERMSPLREYDLSVSTLNGIDLRDSE